MPPVSGIVICFAIQMSRRIACTEMGSIPAKIAWTIPTSKVPNYAMNVFGWTDVTSVISRKDAKIPVIYGFVAAAWGRTTALATQI